MPRYFVDCEIAFWNCEIIFFPFKQNCVTHFFLSRLFPFKLLLLKNIPIPLFYCSRDMLLDKSSIKVTPVISRRSCLVPAVRHNSWLLQRDVDLFNILNNLTIFFYSSVISILCLSSSLFYFTFILFVLGKWQMERLPRWSLDTMHPAGYYANLGKIVQNYDTFLLSSLIIEQLASRTGKRALWMFHEC